MRCVGSQTKPGDENVLEEPAKTIDSWGYPVGPNGKALCEECGRTIGLTPQGKLSTHATRIGRVDSQQAS